ncbi:MAG: hypothetical protein H0U55_15115 [Rubrobacteraceae bacterium]|nr:hypothetical protein [Rubrobacteraceae bacterium]
MLRDRVLGRRELWLASLFAVLVAFAAMAIVPGKADAGTAVTAYQYTSEPGDYIGAGGQGVYTVADSNISVRGHRRLLDGRYRQWRRVVVRGSGRPEGRDTAPRKVLRR